jgi:hypothetical protein
MEDVVVGECPGDPAKAVPMAYREMGVRPDGVVRYRIQFSDGRIEERHNHISNRAGGPYCHFGFSDVVTQPPRYDPRI